MDLKGTGWLGRGLDRSGSGHGQVAGFCERGNEISVPYNAGNLLTG
jgi:hypothetical protein